MEIGDFSFFAFAPLLLIPLASVYLVLRNSSWEFRRTLFMDTWLIWLASLILTISSYVTLVGISTELGLYWSIPLFLWIVISVMVLFVSNFLASGLLIWLLRKRHGNDVQIFTDALPRPENKTSISRISLFISIAETGTIVLLLSILLLAKAIFEHYYPPQFGIYDI